MDGFDISGIGFSKVTGNTNGGTKKIDNANTVPIGAKRTVGDNAQFTLKANPAYGPLSVDTETHIINYLDMLSF